MVEKAAGADVAVGDHSHSGKCLCGAVTYRAVGLAGIWYCHCVQCRSLTGHYLAACRTERERLTISGEITWSPHSGTSEHGRCASCGSILFWSNKTSAYVSVLPGSLVDAHGIAVLGHIYVSEKGDYYEIADGLPQYATWPAENGSLAQ